MCGFTPQYSAALWIGNDMNIELNTGSAAATVLWSKIMRDVCSQFNYEDFPDPPDNVVRRNGEYFIKGTTQSIKKPAKPVTKVKIKVCAASGEKPTKWCTDIVEKEFKVASGSDKSKAGPRYYCHIHSQGLNGIDPKYKKQVNKRLADDEEEYVSYVQRADCWPATAVPPSGLR